MHPIRLNSVIIEWAEIAHFTCAQGSCTKKHLGVLTIVGIGICTQLDYLCLHKPANAGGLTV
ncbi:MAG TPA: hypothetical protein IAC46_02350 [Candidatus Onthoplasma faecigallinarum]|nr:hypothetical protein [Candidatus Onthoplasma faecigallinarum]